MKTAVTKSKASSKPPSGAGMKMDASPDADHRFDYIATAAYYRAEARGFMPGNELDDWLEAEARFEGAEGH